MGARISATIQKTVGVVFLMALLFMAVGASAKAETLNIGGTGAALGSLRLLADAFEKANPGVTPADGMVTISAAIEEDGRFSLTVNDTGIGIAPEDIEKVVKPFIQVDSTLSRNFDGTGLGLPLTKALIGMHEGTFDMTSELGAGTTATALFPASLITTMEVTEEPNPRGRPKWLAGYAKAG